MAFDRDVTIDINADISGYSTSLSQAIATTEQFAKAADTTLGRIAKLNVISVSMLKNTTTLTGANKLATAQAAAYQQKLAGIETTAKVTRTRFEDLEKTTKRFARDFPIGIDGAVEVVTTLQQSGVKTNAEIAKLGKTFIELGAATGESIPVIGKQFLELNRTFGKSTDEISKMSDSLVQVTKDYGANAGSVVSFAKAIAPVASTIGMSETSVLGLSTAMSRLGEDGYRAANAFNKVLLDLQKSASTGSPEIREYARVLGMTQDNLSDMLKNDPSQVIVRFTDAIQKQGTDSIRTLSNLGLEGVSTFKAISALSREGNLQEIINTSAQSYGNDSTSAGAETALGGVNDQMAKLGESMSQTVANSGKPFLDFLNQVLRTANTVSDALAKLSDIDVLQKAGKVAAPVQAAGGAVGNFIGITAMAALGKNLFTSFRKSDFANEFRQGQERGAAGMPKSVPNSIGGKIGGFWGSVRGPAAPEGGPGFMARMGQAARAGARLGQLGYDSYTSAIRGAMGKPVINTPEGDAVKAAAKNAGSALRSGDMSQLGTHLKALGSSAGKYLSSQNTLAGATGNLAKAFGRATGAALQFAGQGIKAAGSRVGGFLKENLGITGPMMAITAGIAAVMYGKGAGDAESERAARTNGASAANGYRSFNEFAEKAGLATKSVVTFAQAVENAANQVAARNKTREDALTLTADEISTAQTPGYQSAFTVPRGDNMDSKNIALLMRLVLGNAPSTVATSRMLMDVTNQKGEGTGVQTSQDLADLYGGSMTQDEMITEGMRQAGMNRGLSGWGLGWIGGAHQGTSATDVSDAYQNAVIEEIQRTAGQVANTQGDAMGTQYQNQQIEKLWQQGRHTTNTGERETIARTIAALTGNEMDDRFVSQTAASMQTGNGIKNYNEYLTEVAGDTKFKNTFARTSLENKPAVSETPQAQKTANATDQAVTKLLASFDEAAGGASTLGKSLYAAERAAGAQSKLVGDMTDEEVAQLSVKDQAIREATLSPEDMTKQTKAGALIAQDQVKSGQSTNASRIELLSQLANTTEGDSKRPMLLAALNSIEQGSAAERAGMSTVQTQNQRVELGKMARSMGTLSDPEAEKQRQAMISDEQNVYAERVGFMKQFLQQKMQVDLQLSRSEEDYNLQRSHAQRDFQRQQGRAEEQYHKQRYRANRDFNTQLKEMEEDFATQREYQLEDHNKQIRRMMETAASNFYEPFKRIQATDVFDASGLTSNLLEQTKALQSQMANVGTLMASGLSQETIDQLGLGKAENAQQTARLVADLANNPALIAQLEAAAKLKANVAGKMVTDQTMNRDFRESELDWEVSLKRADTAYDLARSRAKKKFDVTMGDMQGDFHTQMSNATQDFNISLADMAKSFQKARKRALQDLANFGKDAADEGKDLSAEFGKAVEGLPGASKNAMIQNTKDMVDSMKGTFTTYFDQNWKKFGLSTSDLATSDTDAATKEAKYVLLATQAVAKYNNSKPGTNNDIDVYYSQMNGKFWDAARKKFFWITPDKSSITYDANAQHFAFAEGGIVTRPVNALIGEAGHSEAVIPLNERGASVLASAMGRYVSAQDVLRSRVQPYSTSVSNSSTTHSYDNKTVFSGPVHVTAQDPNQLAQRLQAQARRHRLVQPVGS